MQSPPEQWEPVTPISVIVPARNEEHHIEACLQGIVAQRYPAHLLQIIVVNDASTDDTALLVERLMQQQPNLQLLQAPPNAHLAQKKRAIHTGIQAATGQLVVTTDADCQHPPQWLRTLVYAFEQGKGRVQFIAAPVVFYTNPILLSVFQTLDFITLQGITAASVSSHTHNMCNGANLAYTRSAYLAVNGFEGIDALPTGDDMLLMHKITQSYPQSAQFVKSQAAIVATPAAPTWHAFLQQRIRWASKAAFFKDRRIFYVLLLVYLFNVWLLALPFIAFFKPASWALWVACLLGKTAIELLLLVPVARFFNRQQYLWWFLWLQPLHIAYTVAAGWLGRFGSYTWKGRVVPNPGKAMQQH